jgi:hypothetical protein
MLITLSALSVALVTQEFVEPSRNREQEQCDAAYFNLGAVPGSSREYCVVLNDDGSTSTSGVYPDANFEGASCELNDEQEQWNCVNLPGLLSISVPDDLQTGDSWTWQSHRLTVLDETCLALQGTTRCFLPVSVYQDEMPENMLFFQEGCGLTMFYQYVAVPSELSEGEVVTRFVADIYISREGGLFPDVWWGDCSLRGKE